MPRDRAIRLVVFDSGGVLVRIAESWSDACARAGVALATDFDVPPLADLFAALTGSYQLGEMAHAAFCAAIAAASGSAYSSDEVDRVWRAWSGDQYPNVCAVFDALDRVGVRTAILSNTNAAHWDRLIGVGQLEAEYPVIRRAGLHFASHLMHACKPERAVYDLVADTSGVAPEATLFFDDVLAHIAGAREAGWNAEWIDRRGDTAAQMRSCLERYGVVAAADLEVGDG